MVRMAAPFLKWAGGKWRLAPVIAGAIAGLPVQRYLEPFLGGGGMFFGLRRRGLAAPAVLNDADPALMLTFRQVRDAPGAVIAALERLASEYLAAGHAERAALYYRVRASEPDDEAEQAARLIFLNRTCYNGLYRLNRRGQFNVPHGRYARPLICDAEKLRACSEALRSADLRCGDFAEVCELAGPGDFVYLDPPYVPLSATSNFTAYTGDRFGPAEQARLARAVRELAGRGAWFALSNSALPEVEELYRGFSFRTVTMPRAINSRPSLRAPVAEYLVTNLPARAGEATAAG